jgi:hypothetical protein
MPRAVWLLLVLATAAGGAVGAVPRVPVSVAAHTAVDQLSVDDPFPIRRVRGADARLPELLKELEPGPTVRLPRPEFESRVRAAGRAALAAKQAARVVDAAYTAELDGNDLTGTAELTLLNAHGTTGFVPLDPLRIAVRSAKWSDGQSAVLAVPQPGGAPAVWVDRGGRNVLHLGWSLAGTTEPGERRFELRVPSCAAATLELLLPAEQVPTVAPDVLLAGPFSAPGKPDRRAWRLRFGGRARAEFAVRSATAAGGTAQAKLVAKYDLAPGQLTAAFEYELRPARGSAGEWAFTADPGLRITDVVTNNRAGWTVDPPATPDGPRRVRVTLRQPAPGGKVLVTAVAPFPDPRRPADAPLPAIRPLGAVLDDEKVELRLAPGLKPEAWNAGDYRPTEVLTAAPGTADQALALALVGTLLPPGSDEPFRRMPSVRTAPADAEFTTFERLEWNLDPAQSVLVARVSVRVRRGPLFQITVRPPPGYTLDRSAAPPDEFVSHVGGAPGGPHVVEFARPLSAGQHADVRLEFRGPPAKPGEPRVFPALAVTGAAEREGWLSVTAGHAWALATHPGAGAVAGGLWGWFTTDAPVDARALYLFRGKEPDGAVTLTAARPKLAADALVRIDAAGGEWVTTTRFTVRATGGAVPALAVFVPGPRASRVWKVLDDTNAVVDAVPIPSELLAPVPIIPLLDPVGGSLGPGGTVWVLRFARPFGGVRGSDPVLETTATGPATSEAAVALPVPRVLSAAQTTRAEVALGLRDRTEALLSGDFVRPRARPSAGALAPESVSDVYLVTAIRGPDDVVAAFGGTVRDGRGGLLRVFPPPAAEVRGVCVGGRWLAPAACAERDSTGALRIPIPAGAAVRFEVRYRLPVAPGWPTRRVESPVPELAGGTPAVARWWGFAPGILPGSFWSVSATELNPPLLGGPMGLDEPGALVVRSADESRVWVGASRTADALAGALAAVILVVGVVAAKRRRVRGAVVLASAVVLALVVVEFGPPWWARAAWPPLCAATAALALVLIAVAVHRRAPAPALAAPLLFLVPVLSAVGQPPAPVTVLVVTTGAGEEVIAARATLDRLDALARPVPPAPVVTAASYDVQTDETGARVTAKFAVRAFRSSDNVLSLPLGDARLERATVNGAPALPTSLGPNLYAIGVGGPGRHEVEVRFAATVTAAGPERDLRFGVPEVPETKLTAALPAAARQPGAFGRVGQQKVTAGGERTVVEADLGAAKAVHLRWREGTGGAAAVKVREACVWDVSESGADLTAAYLVRVEQGAVGVLRYEIPAELEVLRVAARTLDAPAGPVPLRDWTLAPEKSAFRQLRVEFQAPAAGRLLVVLECAPRKPLTRQPVLRFPRIIFGAAANPTAGETDAVYGLRASRVVIDGVNLSGVIDFPADALKDFASVPDLRLDPANPVRAFKPVNNAAELRPVLHAGEPVAARTATAWHVGPHRADAAGSVSWQSKEPVPLIEFTLAAVKVLEVRGADVASWSQSGGRVQVWLRTGAREGSLEWSGTVTPVPLEKPVPDGLSFDPVHPVVLHARHAGDSVRVRPIAGWTVKPDRSRGWQSVPAGPGELSFRTEAPSAPPLRVHLTPR